MTDAGEVEERQHKRDNYLVAFFELTKDQQLRWATHHEIAEKAGLSDSEAMSIGSLLSERNLVIFRTMGGSAGSLELTGWGVDEAERIIRQRTKPQSQSGANTHESSVEADRSWVEMYRPMIRLAYDAFCRESSWPDLDTLQRAVDRSDIDIDVREALQVLPREAGETRSLFPTQFYLPLRMLRFLPEAEGVLDICFELVRRAVETYFSDSDMLTITSKDSWFAWQFSTSRDGLIAVRLLMADFPSPIGGGGINSDGNWSLGINGTMARRFRDIRSIDDYFDRQRELKRESQEQLASLVSASLTAEAPVEEMSSTSSVLGTENHQTSETPMIFVVMPFTENWSSGIYDFIKRAIRSIDLSDDNVIRADAITTPGKIDQQIVSTIMHSDLVVGDITNMNPNVMWELGYAEAAGKPIVILNQRIDDSPFDLANTRQVAYRVAPTDDDEKTLAGHISAALTTS